MRDHERHGKLKFIDVFEYELDESQSIVVVEEELEFPLENGCTLFGEVHDSTTLESTLLKPEQLHEWKPNNFLEK